METTVKKQSSTPASSFLRAPLSVAYKKEGREWVCIALNFGIVGVGRTREKSFAEMKDLLNTYFEAVLEEDGPVRFFNPARAEDWDSKDQEIYQVEFLYSPDGEGDGIPDRVTQIMELRHVRGRFLRSNLSPLD